MEWLQQQFRRGVTADTMVDVTADTMVALRIPLGCLDVVFAHVRRCI
jgi:hypothetical protein